tara:strand:- start:199 stop:543 length:345 start_codon:yes stop_codon:yes gene_type:complete
MTVKRREPYSSNLVTRNTAKTIAVDYEGTLVTLNCMGSPISGSCNRGGGRFWRADGIWGMGDVPLGLLRELNISQGSSRTTRPVLEFCQAINAALAELLGCSIVKIRHDILDLE